MTKLKLIWKVYGGHPIRLAKRLFLGEIPIDAYVQVSKSGKNIEEDKELVSVVIPIYDRVQELRESIESILAQTYDNIELILVCDGSPEETIKVVEEYRNNPKVVIYRYYNNSGNAVRGRNKAILEAKGKYLAFQDSDDIAEKTRIERSLHYLKEFNADVVYGGWRAKVDGTRKIDLKDGQEVFSPDCDYDFLKEICVPCQSTVMAKIDALRDVGGLKTTMRYREDHELWLRLAYFGYKFKAIPEILTNLRLHENNLELQFKGNDEHWKELTMQEHTQKGTLPKKIGYVISGCDISGGLEVACVQANYLLNKGIDVSFVCTGIVHDIDWFPDQKVAVYSANDINDNYDVLIATYWLSAYQVEQMHARRKIYFIQSDERKFYSNSNEIKQVEQTYQFNFEWMTIAKWIQIWLNKEYNKSAFLVRNGIDKKLFYPGKALQEKGEKIRVLIEGPMTIPFKGVKEAFEIVKNIDCEVWYVSSDGKPNPRWKCDRFFEKVKLQDMQKIYASCDILLKMSQVESFCLPALEMMACGGVPVVAKVNGVTDFLKDGYNGFIIEQGDKNSAKERIELLIKDRKMYDSMAKNALKTADEWTWDNTLKELPEFLLK